MVEQLSIAARTDSLTRLVSGADITPAKASSAS